MLAARTANGAIGTDQRVGTVSACYCVGAQMAATLARATFSTGHLASQTDRIPTDGTACDMLGTGTLTTGPTALPAAFTVGLITDRTVDHTTLGAQNILAGATLADTRITTNMPVAIQSQGVAFALAGMASGALDNPSVAIACHLNSRLTLAVREIDLRHAYRRMDNGIGIEIDLDAQPVIFDLLSNLAL